MTEHEHKLGIKGSRFKVVNDVLVNVMDSIMLPSEPKKKKIKCYEKNLSIGRHSCDKNVELAKVCVNKLKVSVKDKHQLKSVVLAKCPTN